MIPKSLDREGKSSLISRLNHGKDKMNKNECKPEIVYPCRWVYKVIGRDLSLLHSAVAEVLSGENYAVTPSRSSKGGAYHCLSVELTVESESVRVGFYEKLRRHPAAIMVL
jgi:putative lipoic acid-binding regulatory protein